jgi:hypothetical protein
VASGCDGRASAKGRSLLQISGKREAVVVTNLHHVDLLGYSCIGHFRHACCWVVRFMGLSRRKRVRGFRTLVKHVVLNCQIANQAQSR